jgi:hypothetical protein
MSIQNEVIFKLGRGPAVTRGRKPQAGSKRGRPFDFSCSIHPKYGQIMNENLRIYERFQRKTEGRNKKNRGIFLT